MNNEEAIEYLETDISRLWDTPQNRAHKNALQHGIDALKQQSNRVLCKDCKYFEYDSVAKVDDIPLIVAHEICKRWGDGCKTDENGWCFLAEKREEQS